MCCCYFFVNEKTVHVWKKKCLLVNLPVLFLSAVWIKLSLAFEMCWVWKSLFHNKKSSWRNDGIIKMIIIITNICLSSSGHLPCSVPVIWFNVNGVFTLFNYVMGKMSIISYERWKWCFKYQHTLYLLFLSANFTCLDIQILFKFWIGFYFSLCFAMLCFWYAMLHLIMLMMMMML